MKNKKNLSIFLIIIIAMGIIFTYPTASHAISFDQIFQQGNDWMNQGASDQKVSSNQIATILRPLANFLLGIGTVIIVIVTAVVGIQYMGASPDARGKMKGQLVGLAISAIVLFGAYGIWTIAYRIMTSLTTATGG